MIKPAVPPVEPPPPFQSSSSLSNGPRRTRPASDMTPNDNDSQDQVEYETKENKDIRNTTPSLDTEHPLTTLPSSNSDPNLKSDTQALTAEPPYLEGPALVIVMSGLLLSLFLPALDQLILVTAIPRIVSQFKVLSELSWIPNAYFLTMASFMIIFGQILNLAPSKYVLLTSVFIFELGSLLCGVAFNMNFLLFGRGVAGVGAAGVFVAMFSIIAQIAPLHKRPKLMGIGGTVFGITSILGPLIGGALTDASTWRWCFFINLPIGGVAALVVIFFLPNYPAPPRAPNRQGWKALASVDYVGAILVIGATVCFLYSLVEGGNAHPWRSAIIIALFITSGILSILLVMWSRYRGKEAVLPIHLLKNWSLIGACLCNFFIWMNLMISSVYLATWYQAVKGVSPTRSGIDILPLSLFMALFAALSGAIVSKIGTLKYILVGVPLLSAVAAGLEFTINEHTPEAKLAGYQILWGSSLGACLQLPTLAAQAEYPDSIIDTRYATSVVSFVGFLGRMVGLGIGSALFTNKLGTYLKIFAPNAPYQTVLNSVTIIWQLSPEIRDGVIHAYVLSLRYNFVLGVPASGLASLTALIIKNRRFKKPQAQTNDTKANSSDTAGSALENGQLVDSTDAGEKLKVRKVDEQV